MGFADECYEECEESFLDDGDDGLSWMFSPKTSFFKFNFDFLMSIFSSS